MDAAARHQRIVDLLARAGYQSVPALAKALRVSGMTVRRDLDELERRGLITRTYGGAVGAGGQDLTIEYGARRRQHAEAKARIAAKAAAGVAEGATLYLDNGTTSLALAERLVERRGLTIVTPSLPVANALSATRESTLHVLGGELRPALLGMVGPQASAALAAFRFDVAFLGASAVDTARGLTRTPVEEIPLKCQAAKQAARVVVLATRDKLGPAAGMVFLGCDEIDSVIVDTADGAEELRVPRKGAG